MVPGGDGLRSVRGTPPGEPPPGVRPPGGTLHLLIFVLDHIQGAAAAWRGALAAADDRRAGRDLHTTALVGDLEIKPETSETLVIESPAWFRAERLDATGDVKGIDVSQILFGSRIVYRGPRLPLVSPTIRDIVRGQWVDRHETISLECWVGTADFGGWARIAILGVRRWGDR